MSDTNKSIGTNSSTSGKTQHSIQQSTSEARHSQQQQALSRQAKPDTGSGIVAGTAATASSAPSNASAASAVLEFALKANRENIQVQQQTSQLSSLSNRRNTSESLFNASQTNATNERPIEQQSDLRLLSQEFGDNSNRSPASAAASTIRFDHRTGRQQPTTTTTTTTAIATPTPTTTTNSVRPLTQATCENDNTCSHNQHKVAAAASHQVKHNNNNHHHHHHNRRLDYIDVNSNNEEAQRLIGKSCLCRTLGNNSNCPIHNNRTNNTTTTTTNDAKRTNCKRTNMSLNMQTARLIPAYFIAELLGTFLLVLIGDGAIAAFVVTRRQVDVFTPCFAFGVGAMIATFVSGKISGAHLNPAASLAFALDNRLKWFLVPVYFIAQYLGGFLAALVLFLNYNEAINSLDDGQHTAFGFNNSTGSIFATYPASYVSIWGALMDQILGTAVLLFSLSAVTDKNNYAPKEGHQPLLVAFVIGLICVAFSPNCGAIFNPARDLAPRLVTAMFGYQSTWDPLDGLYWILAGVIGPHLGAIVGVFAYKYLIGMSLNAVRRHTESVSIELDSSAALNCGLCCQGREKYSPPSLQHHQPRRITVPHNHQPDVPADYGAAAMR